MYNIDQLNAMSDEQLRELAKSMGIKKPDSVDHGELIFQVLDTQAGNEVIKDDAVINTEKSSSKKQNKSEDKPALVEKAEEVKPAEAEQPAAEKETPAPVEAPKRKRGRPSAAEKAAREAAMEVQANQPAEPEQAPAELEVAVQEVEKPARKRGRKTKQVVEQPVLPFDNMENQEQPMAMEDDFQFSNDYIEENEPMPMDDDMSEMAAEVKEQNAGTSSREREDVSLNSFFNTGSSFTFKPRTQEEKEEAMRRAEEERKRAAEEAAVAPIVIQEPKVVKEMPR